MIDFTTPRERYVVQVYHGETFSAYYAIDTHAPHTEQPAVVQTWTTVDHGINASYFAYDFCNRHNVQAHMK